MVISKGRYLPSPVGASIEFLVFEFETYINYIWYNQVTLVILRLHYYEQFYVATLNAHACYFLCAIYQLLYLYQ